MDKKPLSPPQEKSVFEQVKKERAPKGEMSVQDIIKADVERAGGDFPRAYIALSQKMRQEKTRILREGNSLLIYNILSPGVAEVHLASTDGPKELMKAVKSFYESMKKLGFKQAKTSSNNPQIPKLLSSAGVPVRVAQMPSTTGQMNFELSFGE